MNDTSDKNILMLTEKMQKAKYCIKNISKRDFDLMVPRANLLRADMRKVVSALTFLMSV